MTLLLQHMLEILAMFSRYVRNICLQRNSMVSATQYRTLHLQTPQGTHFYFDK